jgi:glutathione S-transferase
VRPSQSQRDEQRSISVGTVQIVATKGGGMSEIVFYYNPLSRARIVHWMLEEIGEPYRIELLSFDKREHKKPEFLAINPMGKVPAIVHNGTVVTEAAAICTYLADMFPAKKLAPGLQEPARGTYLRWLFFGANCVDSAMVDRLFSRPPLERPGALGYGSYDDVVQALEIALTPGPFILGERFSAADIYIGAQIGRALMTKSLEPREIFQKYAARCTERPAYQRFMAQNAKLVEQMQGAPKPA